MILCFEYSIKLICKYLKNNTDEINPYDQDFIKNNFSHLLTHDFKFYNYTEFYKVLSPYFQLLFQIVKYVNESDFLSYEEKYQNIKIFRAEMDKDEIYLFFLNSLSEYGVSWEFKFKGYFESITNISNPNNCLITKYNFLKHILGDEEIQINFDELFPDLLFSWDSDEDKERKRKYRNEIFE